MSDGEFLQGSPASASPLRFDLDSVVMELTRENSRLQKLVAELLARNEELRRSTLSFG
jgi:hypothetical protein